MDNRPLLFDVINSALILVSSLFSVVQPVSMIYDTKLSVKMRVKEREREKERKTQRERVKREKKKRG